MRTRVLPLLLVLACPPPKKPEPADPSARCQVNLDETQLFSKLGNGARARKLEAPADFIGGDFARARVGDLLLQNDKVRVVIQQAGRTVGALPQGGAIIDADLVRPSGPGRDLFGKLMPVYAFGRTPQVSSVEVLDDGSRGGFAVIAATGTDAVLDTVNVPAVVASALGDVPLRSNPDTALPLTVTTYYVLSPGETRVRVVTAFCNSGRDAITTMVGDLIDPGGQVAFFNPSGCTNGLGSLGCLIDPSSWLGFQGEGLAYGYRSYSTRDRRTPAVNATLSVGGVVAVMSEGANRDGVLSWTSTAREPTGSFGILPQEPRLFVRDLFIEPDLARVQATMLSLDATGRSKLDVTVLDAAGQPAAAARIAVVTAESGRQLTLAIADAQGKARFEVPVGNYRVSTGALGQRLENPVDVAAPSAGEASVTLRQGASRTLTVTVRDPSNRPLTAKVIVKCPSGACAVDRERLKPFFDLEPLPADVQAVEFVGSSGTARVALPPGAYEVFVSRGPEFSAFPDTFPTRGQAVDLDTADATVTATLAQVVDTTGWLSADLHTHAVASPDSAVSNAERVASLAAEGIEVVTSTDADSVTDLSGAVRDLGLSSTVANLVGSEVSAFDFGTQSALSISAAAEPFDWAGGDGPTLRLNQSQPALRQTYPGVVLQLNRPRGLRGVLTQFEIDTARGTSSADPAVFRMDPNPAATATDTGLFSFDFDALEVMSGSGIEPGVVNDWLTFLSRGSVKTATGVSGSRARTSSTPGLARTWVFLGDDATAARFTPQAFAAALTQRRAVASSGPFVTMTARALDSAMQPVRAAVSVGQTLSIDRATEKVQLTVDVQAPEWLQFDTLELSTHATGRESTGGVANPTWPEARLAQKKTYPVGTLPLEAVPGLNGFTARRVHLTETFTVQPTSDTWYVVTLRSSSAVRALSPAAWSSVTCSAGLCTASSDRPQALTNAILIDADGSGAYDDFPLKPGQPLRAVEPPRRARAPTGDELDAFLRQVLAE